MVGGMTGQGSLTEYLKGFDELIKDERTGKTFGEIVRGIINAGSLVCQRVAAHSRILSKAKEAGQRVSRFATGESTKRSEMDAEHLVAKLCERGVEQLAESDSDELWLIADPSDLRKPHAQEMENLMQVRDLDGNLVPGAIEPSTSWASHKGGGAFCITACFPVRRKAFSVSRGRCSRR